MAVLSYNFHVIIISVLYGLLLLLVPRSPRWLLQRGRSAEAEQVLQRIHGQQGGHGALLEVQAGLHADANAQRARVGDLFKARMRLVLCIGLGLGFFQQITGINAIFYYSTTIFGLAGAGREAALWQAILVGLVNVAFTLVAMRLIDRLGRKPLLLIGSSMMALALFANGLAFSQSRCVLAPEPLAAATAKIPETNPAAREALTALAGRVYDDSRALNAALRIEADKLVEAADQQALMAVGEDLGKATLEIQSTLVLLAILLYIAAFAISLGPVMWAMFSEIFPQRLRGVAISLAGFFNSAVSFAVQQLFPRGLESLGPANVFFVFAGFSALAFLFSWRIVPETKGKSLEELERLLAR